MRNKFLHRIFMLLLISCFFTVSGAQEIKDVFILVDVSGTMKNQDLNLEARGIVKEILKGSIDLNKHDGWNLTSGVGGCELITTPRQIIQPGSYINIIPFGEKYRCRNINQNKKRIQDANDIEQYFNNTYNFSYTDQFTFLNLLKSYVAGMAKAENIKYCYVFTITDNLIDETGSNPYSSEENNALNSYETEKSTKVQNIGILDKSIGAITCKIFMEKFEQFTVKVSVENIYTQVDPPSVTDTSIETTPVKFSTPKKNGTQKDPLSCKDSRITLKWYGGETPYSLVVRKNSNGNKIVDETLFSNSLVVRVNNSGLYSASITDAKGTSDIVYFEQGASIPWKLVIFALILGGIAYMAFNWWNERSKISQDTNKGSEFGSPKPNNPFGGGSASSGGGGEDDW